MKSFSPRCQPLGRCINGLLLAGLATPLLTGCFGRPPNPILSISSREPGRFEALAQGCLGEERFQDDSIGIVDGNRLSFGARLRYPSTFRVQDSAIPLTHFLGFGTDGLTYEAAYMGGLWGVASLTRLGIYGNPFGRKSGGVASTQISAILRPTHPALPVVAMGIGAIAENHNYTSIHMLDTFPTVFSGKITGDREVEYRAIEMPIQIQWSLGRLDLIGSASIPLVSTTYAFSTLYEQRPGDSSLTSSVAVESMRSNAPFGNVQVAARLRW